MSCRTEDDLAVEFQARGGMQGECANVPESRALRLIRSRLSTFEHVPWLPVGTDSKEKRNYKLT